MCTPDITPRVISSSFTSQGFPLVHPLDKTPGAYQKSESKVAQSYPTLCNPMNCSLWGSSIHGIFQARVLEWVAVSFSRGSFQPRDWTRVSSITKTLLFLVPNMAYYCHHISGCIMVSWWALPHSQDSTIEGQMDSILSTEDRKIKNIIEFMTLATQVA